MQGNTPVSGHKSKVQNRFSLTMDKKAGIAMIPLN
jgi:hypothetical protein